MADPLMVTVATTLAAWATTTLAERARTGTAALVALVRERFRREPSSQRVVDAALDGGDDPQAVERLAELLELEAARDPAFGERLRGMWDEVATQPGGTVNLISGEVAGPVVQARDVRGGIHFGDVQRQPPSPS